MQLLSLPIDVVLCIIETTAECTDIRDLIRMRLTCKSLDEIITGYIFRTGALRERLSFRNDFACWTTPAVSKYLHWRIKTDNKNSCELVSKITKTAQDLKNYGYEPLATTTRLCNAVEKCCVDSMILGMLFNDFPISCKEVIDNTVFILCAAAFFGDIHTVKAVTETLQDRDLAGLVDLRTCFGSPLTAAVYSGNIQLVKHLLPFAGSFVTAYNFAFPFYKESPLSVAAKSGHFNILQLLYDHSIPESSKDLRYEAMTDAGAGGHWNIIEWLTQQDPAISLNEKFKHSYSNDWRDDILWAAARYNHPYVVERLLAYGTDPPLCGLEGNAFSGGVLSDAAFFGHDEILKLFIARGGDFTVEHFMARSPVAEAIRGGKFDTLKLLVENGFDIGGGMHNPVSAAVEMLDCKALRYLFDRGAHIISPPRNYFGNLIFSTTTVEIIQLLVDFGYDVHSGEATDEKQLARIESPLQTLIKAGNWEAAKFLVKKGVRPLEYRDGRWLWID